jgi:ferrous iron transport protein B
MNTPVNVALVGNPNTGKTTLFNRLTGARERVGNWSGVTVEQAEARAELAGHDVRFVDLPGIFALATHTLDERITRDFLVSGQADRVLNVVDASNLERSLCLTKQLLDLRVPLVVALNLSDVARRRGLCIDAALLQQSLGCPVVPVVASRGEGMRALEAALAQVINQQPVSASTVNQQSPRDAEEETAAAEARLAFARGLARAVVQRRNPSLERTSDRVDRVLLSSWAGVPFFLGVMYLIFWLTVQATQPLVNFIDSFVGAFLVHGLRAWLEGLGVHSALISVLADGAGAGLAAVATFIPPIFAIFICLGLLEGSGYMPRAAFVMDRLLRRIGLPGKAFIPLIVGFGCTVPALLATRTLEQRRDRLLTMLITPFMSCGARLPVYTLFALAFFPHTGSRIVFLLYLAGIVLAVLSGLLLHRTVLPGEPAAYVIELPPYHLPPFRLCLDHAWFNLRSFLLRAGKVIVGVAVGLSLLNVAGDALLRSRPGAPSSGPAAILGRTLTPVFVPMGIAMDNWPASVGLLTGLLAKESVIGTLDVLYAQIDADAASAAAKARFDLHAEIRRSVHELGEGYGLRIAQPPGHSTQPQPSAWPGMLTSLRLGFGSGAAAFAYLLFVLVYSPCLAALAVLAREAGGRWMLFSVCYQTLLAWMVATAFYQTATFKAHPQSSSAWLAGIVLLAAAGFLLLRRYGRRILALTNQ